MQRSSVLLPHPLGPNRHTKRRSSIVTFNPFRTTSVRAPSLYCLPRLIAAMFTRPPLRPAWSAPIRRLPSPFPRPVIGFGRFGQVHQLDLQDAVDDRVLLHPEFGDGRRDEAL